VFERLRSVPCEVKDGVRRVRTAPRRQEIRRQRTRSDFLRSPGASERAGSVFELVEVVFERLGSDLLRVEHRSQLVEHGLLSVEIDPERDRGASHSTKKGLVPSGTAREHPVCGSTRTSSGTWPGRTRSWTRCTVLDDAGSVSVGGDTGSLCLGPAFLRRGSVP